MLQDVKFRLERLFCEPGTGRTRAVLEIRPAPWDEDDDHGVAYPCPRLQFLNAAGDPVLSLELDGHGVPSVQVELPDHPVHTLCVEWA